MYKKKQTLAKLIALLLDLCCIAFSLAVAFQLRYGTYYGVNDHGDQRWILVYVLLIYVALNVFTDYYKHFFRRSQLSEFTKVVEVSVLICIIMIVYLYMTHRSGEVSRLVLGYFLVANMVLMFLERVLYKQIMLKGYRRSRYSSRLLIVTQKAMSDKVLKNVLEYNEWFRQVVGIAVLDAEELGQVGEIPIVAREEDFIDYVIHNEIDEVFFIGKNMDTHPRLEEWVNELGQMGVVVDVNIDAFDISFSGKRTMNQVGKYAVVSFARNIFSNRQLLLKRTMDICGSLVGMVFLAIAFVIVAPIIKLDSPGPVLFGQKRVGKNGRIFTFYKFRSMYVDAEERKKELMAQNEVEGLMFKMKDDPRITKVGKFLRKTSIDELPQFWNILKGDMSLVGTRPPTVDEYKQYEARHKARLSMTPGLTGLWQVSGRSDIKDFEEVVKLDMQYIDNWSVLEDIKILLLTVKVVLLGRGSR